jgi:hypothetical protein
MKTTAVKISIICAVLIGIIWACKSDKAEMAGYLPLDVSSKCVLTQAEFNKWFKSGTVSENGEVLPANSVDFVHNNNCDFYKWSEQMFLWITSSDADGTYGGGNTVMESPVFYTISPKQNGKRFLVPHKKGQLLRAMANIDLDISVNTEEGQATDDVLMDKNGNIVYYISMANDGYAEYLTAAKNGKMGGKTFPTTAAERDSIFMFAKERGVVLKAPNTLAIELKTSWVVAESIPNPEDYVTVEAIIPTYTKTEKTWTAKGERKAKLALVGMHIVGSTDGHPEMVWATFEHENCAPNAKYQYINDKGVTVTVPADTTSKGWLLNSNVKDTANVSHMTFSNDSIISQPNYTVSPSNTRRTKPWGSAYNMQPNAEDASPAAANSEILAINNAIRRMLPDGDVRKKYLFIGATWTQNGAGPLGTSYSPTLTTPGVAIGSSQLANCSMETYIQNGMDYNESGSCFLCHSNSGGLLPSDLSHVYKTIVPLPNRKALVK